MKTLRNLLSILILVAIVFGVVSTITLIQPEAVQAKAKPPKVDLGTEPPAPIDDATIPIFTALKVNWNK